MEIVVAVSRGQFLHQQRFPLTQFCVGLEVRMQRSRELPVDRGDAFLAKLLGLKESLRLFEFLLRFPALPARFAVFFELFLDLSGYLRELRCERLFIHSRSDPRQIDIDPHILEHRFQPARIASAVCVWAFSKSTRWMR